MNKQRGITLIALVVTIVVLLILASISIKALTGDNGLIDQAKNGKEASEISEEKEIINIAVTQATEKDQRGELTKEALQKELDRQIGEGKTEVREAGEKIEVCFVEKKRYYEVDKEGKVAETSISIKFTLSHTEEVPTAGGNVSEIREGNVPIPTGFTYVEGTRDTGLVIADSEGNEFVWVPVNQNQKLTLDVTSKEDITEIKLIGPDGAETTLTASGKTFNQEIAMTKNGVYTVEVSTASATKTAEKRITSLYAQDPEIYVIYGTYYTKKYFASERYSTTKELLTAKSVSSLEELVTNAGCSSIGEFMVNNNIFVDDQENEFKKYVRMAIESNYIDNNQNTESVNKYGGFYIARYEAGDGTTSSARTDSAANTNTLVSKKGAYVYNYVDWETSRTLATGLESSNTAVTSQLITGAGWSRTLNWIIETGSKTENEVILDSRSWGNYDNSTGNAAENSGSSNMNDTTGRSEYWKANNIYDLAGNTWEWTQEQNSTFGTARGGNFNDNGDDSPASDLFSSDITYMFYAYISFRVQLYINV